MTTTHEGSGNSVGSRRGMSPDEARGAVAQRARVRLRDGQGGVVAEGRIVSYSIVPTVCIVTDDGRQIHWRHDLAEWAERS